MKCPVCGAAELMRDTRDVSFTYKGETTVIPAVTGDFCPACDESITDMAEGDDVRARRHLVRQRRAALHPLHAGVDEALDFFGRLRTAPRQ